MLWAVILYALEALTLLGVPAMLAASQYGPVGVSNGTRVVGAVTLALTFAAIWRLSLQSSATHATELGWALAIIQALYVPNFIQEMTRGYVVYTGRRAVLVVLGSMAGIALITMLAFG